MKQVKDNLFACNMSMLQEQLNMDYTMYMVGTHFVAPLYYGDVSGLEDDDLKAFDLFVETYGDAIIDSIEWNMEVCDISGVLSQCSIIVMRDKAAAEADRQERS